MFSLIPVCLKLLDASALAFYVACHTSLSLIQGESRNTDEKDSFSRFLFIQSSIQLAACMLTLAFYRFVCPELISIYCLSSLTPPQYT